MKNSAIIVLCLVLSACGGGGGGSDGGSAASGIRVLHAAVDTAPLDIVSALAPEVIVGTTRFAQLSPYLQFPEGAQDLVLTKAKTTAPQLFSLPLEVTKGMKNTVLVFGNQDDLGLRIVRFDNDASALAEALVDGQSGVRVVHGVVGAGHISVSLGGEKLFASIPFGGVSEYLLLDSGSQSLLAIRAADKKTLKSAALNFESKRVYTVLVSGEAEFYVVVRAYQD
ncbi:DUF4397 domain-containing protein [Oligoflexia bacterium]|nr:DUF4397 domain-containing protein [Oligoflexia bacterium]